MNRLNEETSPYLRQHAHNPVAWQPWDAAALAEARAADKPILLSIGYAACHWCHVMAHESFEDLAVGALMNELFVNVKVDREERPDLDKIYQLAHQLLARRGGGWPLTVFLDPHTLLPFFTGTYFPPRPRHGLPGFADLCQQVARIWREQRGEVQAQNGDLQRALDLLARPEPADSVPPASLFGDAELAFVDRADTAFGGLKGAPKFPHPALLAFQLERAAARERAGMDATTGDAALRLSLNAMAGGGLYDHLAGGFFRYCVDERWEIPHFEKMLYDNAQLLRLYADAAGLYGEPRYARAARETGEWLLATMQAPGGAFYATLDADSEGQEGRYYLWTREQCASLLDPDEYRLASAMFGLEHGPNFREQPDDPGHWHLTERPDLLATAEALGFHRKQAPLLIESARAKLAEARRHRLPPGRDEKILSAWNGLAIGALARAGARLNRPDFVAAAEAAADFLRRELWRDGRLLAVHTAGVSRLTGTLDDYAFVMDGLLCLLEVRWRNADFAFLLALDTALRRHFEDTGDGGFYFTADDHEPLPQRSKPLGDDATPAGNGIAARVLLRLGHVLADAGLLASAERALCAAGTALAGHPLGHASLLGALNDWHYVPELILLRGPAPWLALWLDKTRAGYHPERLVLALPNDAELPPALAERYPPQADATAYICRGSECLAPITDLDTFTAWLDRDAAGRSWQ